MKDDPTPPSVSAPRQQPPTKLTRNVRAVLVPHGTEVTLTAGETATLTENTGPDFIIIVRGSRFRLDPRDANDLGLNSGSLPTPTSSPAPTEDDLWRTLRRCHDPEIPVNIVDLGLVYSCGLKPHPGGGCHAEVTMTLTNPGCGMGAAIVEEVRTRLSEIPGVDEVSVDLVWDPPWDPSRMTDGARLQLGLA